MTSLVVLYLLLLLLLRCAVAAASLNYVRHYNRTSYINRTYVNRDMFYGIFCILRRMAGGGGNTAKAHHTSTNFNTCVAVISDVFLIQRYLAYPLVHVVKAARAVPTGGYRYYSSSASCRCAHPTSSLSLPAVTVCPPDLVPGDQVRWR